MQTYQASLKEIFYGHSVPAVIIGISYYKTGKNKKEIHSQITMIQNLMDRARRISFKLVVSYHNHSGNAAEPVQYFIARLRCQISCCIHYFDIKFIFTLKNNLPYFRKPGRT